MFGINIENIKTLKYHIFKKTSSLCIVYIFKEEEILKYYKFLV